MAPVENLAEELLAQYQETQPVAAALTDTFTLAGQPLWTELLSGSPITPLAGAEVGVSWGGLPYSLLLLAQNPTGFANLNKLISTGLLRATNSPLTALLEPESLTQHKAGLIAIAPYSGGPLMAALTAGKTLEARSRAQTLLDIFGPENFFIGAPSPAAQTRPQTIDGQPDERRIKANAALVKLSRELKIGLVGTGETRYSQPEDARQYAALRSRLQRTLSAQYPRQSLQNPAFGQEWLYAFQAGRPTADLHLRPVAELVAHYNERDWPGALTNNQQIATRCANWQPTGHRQAELRQRCLQELSRLYPAAEPPTDLLRMLDDELAAIADLHLAESFLGAARVNRQASEAGVVVVPRRLTGSLVAGLLGLADQPEGTPPDQPPFDFEAYTDRRPLRLEVGQHGRQRLISLLNEASAPAVQALCLAVSSDPADPAVLHPRLLLVSLDPQTPLTDLVALQPAQSETGPETAAQSGPLPPVGSVRLEISESTGVGRLQLVLDILNRWRRASDQPLLKPADIPVHSQAADSSERTRLLDRLDWLRQHQPAAFYAAGLQLAMPDPAQAARLAEAVRLEGLKLLPPDVQTSEVDFSLEGPAGDTLRVGLAPLVGRPTARQLVYSRQAAPFTDHNDLVRRVRLSTQQIERLGWSGALDGFGPREKLAATAPELAALSEAWQEWQQHQLSTSETVSPPASFAMEQPSLFDLLAAPVENEIVAGPEEPAPVALTGVPPITRLEKLRRAWQTLGFFTAEHPLWAQPVASNGADASSDGLVELARLTSLPDSRPVLISGVITGIRRLPIVLSTEQGAGQGEELTVLQLEDFSGQAQLLLPRDVPALDLQLEEGLAVAARVHRPQQNGVLIAVALSAYPALPGTPAAPAPDDLVETETEGQPVADPTTSRNPPPDENWSSSLFASLGIPDPVPTSAPAATGGQSRGRPGSKPPPPKIHRRVIIRLPRTGSEETDFEMMNQLKLVLRKYPGDDSLILFLPQPDGSTVQVEPQGLEVAYGEAFAAEVTGLTGPGGLKLEELSF